MSGRVTKFIPLTRQAIVELISVGNTRRCAAQAAGVSLTALGKWLARGRAEIERLLEDPEAEPDPTEGEYAAFARDVEQADGEAESYHVANILRAAQGDKKARIKPDWRASAWWLERRRNKDYGVRQAVKLSGDTLAPMRHVVDAAKTLAELPPDELARAYDAELARVHSDPGTKSD